MDIFGYFLTASVTLVGSVIVALAVTKVEDLYLEWQYNCVHDIPRFPVKDEKDTEELIVQEYKNE